MIGRIYRGWNIGGLIRYLMGPGRANEHTGQRVMASWDGDPAALQPPRRANGSFDIGELTATLCDPAVAAGVPTRTAPPARPDGSVPTGPVWHCSLRNAAQDAPLSDDQWAEIAEELMHRTGIARRDDDGGCQWVAIRHGVDHIHIAAMLVRRDTGRRFYPRNDYLQLRQVCRDTERRLGLTGTAPADRTAAPRSTRAEQEKTARHGGPDPGRDRLRRYARLAAVRARDPEGFFAALRDLGVMVRPRYDPGGAPSGYAVALPAGPATSTAEGEPVWYAGGKLARDLTLPRLHQRWASAPAPQRPIPPGPGERSTVGQQEREAAVDEAAAGIESATDTLHRHRRGTRSQTGNHDHNPRRDHHDRGIDSPPGDSPPGDSSADGGGEGGGGDDDTGDAIAHAAGDMLAAIDAATTDRAGRWARSLREISDDYDRAARPPGDVLPPRWPPVAAELRRAAWRLAAVRIGGRDGNAGMKLVLALAALVAEIAALRELQGRHAQALAARRTHELLHARPAPAEPGAFVPASPGTPAPSAGADPSARGRGGPVRPAAPRRGPAVPGPAGPGGGPGADQSRPTRHPRPRSRP